MPTFNREDHKPTTDYFRQLFDAINTTYHEVASATGISRRRLQYLYKGENPSKEGKLSPALLSYPEQFALESLLESLGTSSEPSSATKRRITWVRKP